MIDNISRAIKTWQYRRKILGCWILVERDGRTDWPEAHRYFTKHCYSWVDFSRKVPAQEGTYHIDSVENRQGGVLTTKHGAIHETYDVLIHNERLDVQQTSSIIGSIATYRRP